MERQKKKYLPTLKAEVMKMNKQVTKEQIQIKKCKRLKDKNLKQHLLYRFLNHYGYDKGKVTAKAIIDDILKLVEDFFLVGNIDSDLHHVQYGQLVWMAVPVDEYPQRGKSIAETRMKPVILSFVTEEDIEHFAFGFGSKELRKRRIKRWTDQAFQQGALLTQLDMAILLGVCDTVITQYANEIQKNGYILPTRGNIHDLSGAITHKREIIAFYLEGYLTPEISIKTNHSKEAVDRYIKDYHKVETLWCHGITDLDQISHLAHLSKRVAQQYIDLLPAKLKPYKEQINKNVDNNYHFMNMNSSGETETGTAGEQPVRDNRNRKQVRTSEKSLGSPTD